LTTHYPGDTISAADAAAGGEWSCQFHASDGNDSVTSLSSGYWLGDVDVGDGEEARDYAGDYPTDRCSVTPTSTGTGVGDISPDWELTDQHGESVRLSDFCGSLVLLQAGAMWDPTTAWTTSDLEELYLAHKDSGFIVMSLMGEDISSETPSVADLSAWAEGRELTFPVLSDGGFELTTTYTSGGLGFLPTHTLIGPGMEVLAVNETWISEETIDACLYAPSDCLVGSSDPGDDDEPEDVTCSGDFAYEDAEGCSIITGTLSIIGTDAVDLDLLSALQEVGGDLLIQNNDSLTSFSLDNLTQVGGDLKVWDSGLLTDFSIDNLTSIDGGLYVERNDNLESFSFDSLMSIGGEVKVENNPDLTTFTLDSLTSAGDSIGFIHNASLCQSMVDAFFETMGELGWSDSIASTGNADC
jgi:peroxiredoxin